MATVVARERAVARLRPKNQLTLPDAIVQQTAVQVGDRFRVTVEDGVIHLAPIRRSYAGLFPNLWPADWMEELRRDRDSWQP